MLLLSDYWITKEEGYPECTHSIYRKLNLDFPQEKSNKTEIKHGIIKTCYWLMLTRKEQEITWQPTFVMCEVLKCWWWSPGGNWVSDLINLCWECMLYRIRHLVGRAVPKSTNSLLKWLFSLIFVMGLGILLSTFSLCFLFIIKPTTSPILDWIMESGMDIFQLLLPMDFLNY